MVAKVGGMNDLPGHRNALPDPQDDIAVDECNIHGQYDGTKCPHCARVLVLKQAAVIGLQSQLYRLNKSNAVDFEDLKTDIKRALNFIRLQT